MTLPLPFEDSSSSNFVLPPPPDLLRRFVALPFRGTWVVAGVLFEVTTNREDLLLSFPLRSEPVGGAPVELSVFVDPDIPPANGGACFILNTGQMCWGRAFGSLFSFDWSRRESFIFIPEAGLTNFKDALEEVLRAHTLPD